MVTMAAPAAILPLRDYQTTGLERVQAAFVAGITRQLLAMPTGSGKTMLAAHLIRVIALPRGWVTVFLVHREELATQSIRALGQVNPELSIGLCKAGANEIHANVIVASAQTLAVRGRLDQLLAVLKAAPGVLWISDEAHHDLAATRHRAITEANPDLLIGLTATPERGDGGKLGNLYQEITYAVGLLELMAKGRLARLVGVRIGTDVSLDEVHTIAGELAEGELEHAIDTPERNKLIVDAWRRHASDRGRTVIFCVTVAHGRHVATAFREAGIATAEVYGDTDTEERTAIFAAFHEGRTKVLVNVMVLTEGYDEPAIDCVIMARPTKSRGLYIQCVGRGARTAPGKTDCLVLDMVDVSSRHKLAGMATLTADKPGDISADDEPAAPALDTPFDILERATQLEMRLQQKAAKVAADADAGVAALARETKAVNLFAASPYIWQEYGGQHYAEVEPGRYLVIQPFGGETFRPYVLERTPAGPVLRPALDRGVDFDMAMGIAEDAIPRPKGGSAAWHSKDAAWRTVGSRPTPAQLAAAGRLGIALKGIETKGDLSRLISAAQFTAARRAARLVKA